jgi:hypothetical protein
MPTATKGEARIEIAATPERVYEVVTDVTSIGDRSPECYRCEWVGGVSAPEVGARFKGYNRLGLLRWSTTSKVEVAEPGREFTFMVLAGERDSTRWRYSIETNGDTTILTETYEFLWCPLFSRIAEVPLPRDRQLQRGINQTVERVKARAERPGD